MVFSSVAIRTSSGSLHIFFPNRNSNCSAQQHFSISNAFPFPSGSRSRMPQSKEEAELKQLERKQKREAKRATQRVETLKAAQSQDVFQLGMSEVQAVSTFQQQMYDGEGGEAENDPIVQCLNWLFRAPKLPPKCWETYRREEIAIYIEDTRKRLIFLSYLVPDSLLYRAKRRRRIGYWGETNPKGSREGRGVAVWPDPPFGGGESYFGLWRDNEPHGHGMFRWYDGDMYYGEWSNGLFQGYGVYQYGPTSRYAFDSYQGAYYQGQRQGTGIYTFSGKNEEDAANERGTGVYLGEWLKGKMHGCGVLAYSDGEFYAGTWAQDKKEGLGVYTWGATAGEVAGDKYEGQFKDGLAQGSGRTLFAEGGWHKGRYANGKMNGFGILQTSEGWEYVGTWKDDQLHGPAVCYYIFSATEAKEVQIYRDGSLIGSRPHSTEDWRDIESLGADEAVRGDQKGDSARENVHRCTKYARLAKESQQLAKDQQDEAMYWVKAALEFQKFVKAWFGLKRYLAIAYH